MCETNIVENPKLNLTKILKNGDECYCVGLGSVKVFSVGDISIGIENIYNTITTNKYGDLCVSEDLDADIDYFDNASMHPILYPSYYEYLHSHTDPYSAWLRYYIDSRMTKVGDIATFEPVEINVDGSKIIKVIPLEIVTTVRNNKVRITASNIDKTDDMLYHITTSNLVL